MSDVTELKKNISKIYNRKKVLIIALCNEYAALAESIFHQNQPSGPGITGKYWNNQTSTAADTVFSGTFVSQNVYGFFLAHYVEYGVSLELANDRRHAALVPIIKQLEPEFIKDLKELL